MFAVDLFGSNTPSPLCLHRQATLRVERLAERHGMMDKLDMTAKEEGGMEPNKTTAKGVEFLQYPSLFN